MSDYTNLLEEYELDEPPEWVFQPEPRESDNYLEQWQVPGLFDIRNDSDYQDMEDQFDNWDLDHNPTQGVGFGPGVDIEYISLIPNNTDNASQFDRLCFLPIKTVKTDI